MKVRTDRLIQGKNVRTEPRKITVQQLAQSIAEIGQITSIKCKSDGDRLNVIDGHGILEAAKILQLPEVEVECINQTLSDDQLDELQLVQNSLRSNLSIGDKARAVESLMKARSCTAVELAPRIGMSESRFCLTLGFLEEPEDIQRLISEGKLALSTARELRAVVDLPIREQLLAAAEQGKLTRAAVIATAKQTRRKKTAPESGKISRTTLIIDRDCSVSVKSTKASVESVIAILEELLTKARKARSQGWELGTLVRSLRDQAKAGEP